MTDYKATPEQWADAEEWAAVGGVAGSCLLELRARVEALEHEMAMEEYRRQSAAISKPTSNLSQIRSSLVKRVQQVINAEYEESLGTGSREARAAIREVAAWLREREGDYSVIRWLEQEAGQ